MKLSVTHQSRLTLGEEGAAADTPPPHSGAQQERGAAPALGRNPPENDPLIPTEVFLRLSAITFTQLQI